MTSLKSMFLDVRVLALPMTLTLAACGVTPQPDAEDFGQLEEALSNPAAVLGFESTSYWTASSGTKASSTDTTQGTAALALSNFGYSELTSVPLATVGGTSPTLLLDVKAPVSPAWGQIQIFVSIPSQNIYSAALPAATLVGAPAGAYRTLSFAIPASLQTALAQSYTDLTFKIAVNVPQGTQAYLFDNLRFQTTTTNSVVQLRASNVDDFLYVTVDGVRRKVFFIGDPDVGQTLDVSDWFASGSNDVRIQSVNTGGPGSYQLELWVDGLLVVNDSAPAGLTTQGIAVDKTLNVSVTGRPARQTVQVNSPSAGKLYLNDVFTGKTTPATLTLPQGSYKLGLGVSTEAPFDYTGSFYEAPVTVASSAQTLTLGSGAPLPVQKTNSIVIVPVQNTYNYVTALGREDVSNNGVLNAADVTLLSGQVTATRDVWFKPFSYGLATWDVTITPMVTNTPLREPTPDGLDMDGFIASAGLSGLRTQYDRIVVFFSQQRADGTNVADEYGAVFALGRQLVGYQASYTRLNGPNQPSPYFLHECLHNHEAYNADVLHLYNGAGGLHGANQHGYYHEGSNGETDFLKFYRPFMRGQLQELDSYRPNVNQPNPPPEGTADMYTGVFQTLRVYTGK